MGRHYSEVVDLRLKLTWVDQRMLLVLFISRSVYRSASVELILFF